MMTETALLAFMESIDQRLQDLTAEVRGLRQDMVAKGECARCQRQWLPRRYVLSLAGFFAGLSIVTAFVGDLLGLGNKLAELLR